MSNDKDKSKSNGKNPHKKSWGDNENIVELDQKRSEILAQRKKDQKAKQAAEKQAEKMRSQARQDPSYYMPNAQGSGNPPMFNIPNATKYLLFSLIGLHLIITFLLNDETRNLLFYHLGFVPLRFTDLEMFEPLQLLTPITHMFLHGSWLHIAMNGVMLLAFGSGLEKWIGSKKMIQIFFICGLFGVTAHFIFNLNSLDPVIGASGGLSGLFAVALIMLQRQNQGFSGKYGMLPIIALWVGISVLFGVMGSPDGSAVAWIAHLGGFLGGFIAARMLKI